MSPYPALPKLEHSLGASFTDLQWVIDVYALALATIVLTAGSLADRLGRKRSFLAGLLLFPRPRLRARWLQAPTS